MASKSDLYPIVVGVRLTSADRAKLDDLRREHARTNSELIRVMIRQAKLSDFSPAQFRAEWGGESTKEQWERDGICVD